MNRRRFLIGSAATGGGLFIGYHRVPEPVAAETGPGARLYRPTVWYAIDAGGAVTVHIAKAEVGQHIGTAFAMMIAEELEVPWANVRIDYPDPRRAFGILVTAGSWSVALNFDDMLRFGAAGRIALIEAAARRWAAPVEGCTAAQGFVLRTGTDARVSYGELVASGAVTRTFEDDDLGKIVLKPHGQYRLIGTAPPALDIPAKVDGSARYGIDLFMAGMVYGKLARPPLRAGCKPLKIDDGAARRIAGYLRYVSADDPMNDNGAYVIALAETYPAALAAAKALKIDWSQSPNAAVGEADILARAEVLVADPGLGAPWWIVGNADTAMAGATATFSAEYTTAAVAHAGIEPMSALVFRDGERWHAYAGSAFQTKAAAAIAEAVDADADQVSLHQAYVGDPSGRRVEVDALIPAALAAKATGRPVKMIFDRDEEMRFDFHRAMTYQRLEAGLDARGEPVALRHDLCSAWPLKRALPIALQPGADKKTKLDWSAISSADSWYSFPNYYVRIIENDLAQRAAPAGFMRGAATGYVFWALESFIDDLAHRTGRDAVALRLALLDGGGPNAGGPNAVGGATRLARAIREAIAVSGYDAKRARNVPGRGIGLAASSAPDRNQPSWTCCVAEVAVGRADGAVAVEKLTIVSDVGTAVHADGVLAQIESATLWGLSVALYEQAEFRDGRFTATNFDAYRPLRFDQVPELDIHVISEDHHPTGAGEPAMSVVAPAIANAIFHAVGARVRGLPITPDKVLSALRK